MDATKTIDAARLLETVVAVANESHRRDDLRATLDSSLERDLGLDSLARVELILRLERDTGVSLPESALAAAETPRDLLRLLVAGAGKPARAAEQAVADLAHTSDVGVPDRAQTLTEALAWHVERQPERLTVHLYEEGREYPITYRDLYESSLAWAARLAEVGLQPGQAVSIMLPTSREYLYCFYGVLFAGGVPVPLYPPARLSVIEDHMTRHVGILKSAEAAYMVTVPEAKTLAFLLQAQVGSLRAVLTPADFEGASGADYAPVPRRGGDVAFLQYTSGSTGNPKGVVLTHDNLLANVRAMGKAARVTSADVFVSWLPLYHDMGLIGGCFATMVLGFPVVLMSPLAFLGNPAHWLRAIHRHRGTISGGPNFAYELCLRRIDARDLEGLDLSSWRFAFNGAEPVSPETLEGFAARFSEYGLRRNVLSPVYGLAECSVGLAFTPPGEPWRIDVIDRETFTHGGRAVAARPEAPSPLRVVGCGRTIPDHDVRVVDSAGIELPDRHEGHLQFRGPSATTGYYHNAEATRRLFADDGWLNTGDRAYLAEGVIYLTGREKDLIIRGGRNITPYELEEAIGDLEGVRRGCVAVFGSMDAANGTERVVVLAETRTTDSARLAALKGEINDLAVGLIGAPADDIVLAPPHTVPKTSSGKIRRNAAREFYERGPTSVRPAPVWWQFVRLAAAGVLPQLRRAVSVVRGALFAARAWTLIGIMLPLAWCASAVLPRRAAWTSARALTRAFFRGAGIPVVASGLERLPPHGAIVLAANHTSYLDALVLVSLLPWRNFAFVAKEELRRSRFTRVLLTGLNTLFVERFEARRSAEDAQRLVEAALNGVSIIVFAEGVLRRTTGLMPFRTGAFQVAARAGIPVVPVALRGVRSVLRDTTWWPRRATVTVTFCDPISPAGHDWSAAVELREQVRREVLRHCGEPDLAAPGGSVEDTAAI